MHRVVLVEQKARHLRHLQSVPVHTIKKHPFAFNVRGFRVRVDVYELRAKVNATFSG